MTGSPSHLDLTYCENSVNLRAKTNSLQQRQLSYGLARLKAIVPAKRVCSGELFAAIPQLNTVGLVTEASAGMKTV